MCTGSAGQFDINQAWRRLWAALGAAGGGQSAFDDLVARYGEPHRRYHTLRHLREMLHEFAESAGDAQHPAEVAAAIWFHDAIYDPTRHDNEERSAQLAQSVLGEAGVRPDVCARIGALILATSHRASSCAGDAQLLVDIDLGVLAADRDRFIEYERQVREEYAFVPDSTFREKRRAILQGFLARPHIYGSARFRNRWEAAARANLAWSIAASLTSSAVPDGVP